MSGARIDCAGEAAAYSLGALEPAEAAAFADHAAACVVCRDELAAFAQVTERIALGAPQVGVPRRLKGAVLAAVRADARGPRLGTRRWPATRGAARRSPARRRVAGARRAVLAGLAIGVAAGIIAFAEASSPARSVRTIAASVSDRGASAELRVSSGHAQLVVAGLRQPARGDVYEVWLVRGSRGAAPQPTDALFGVTARGDGDVEVPGDLRSVREVLVTEEPAGGTRAPTSPAVVAVRI